MSLLNKKYEAVIGLEVHAQLRTMTKAYSSEENIYGAKPNTKTSFISLGHPGTLPKINKKVIDYAIKLGLSLGSKIRKENRYARKNYFYADLPKGYQITQDKTPICDGGQIIIHNEQEKRRLIGITRIHMEEDAGKSIHDLDPFHTLIDLNRAGVPLLEIVSEPDLRSSHEAYQYINQIRRLVKYLDICDGNMEEGSLRCDANISVRIKGSKEFGTKVEVKNMNSTTNVKRAIDFEINRQINMLEKKEIIISETRTYNAQKNITLTMREKESANDYRYFPEPDIPPVIITEEYINSIEKNLPPLPDELLERFITKMNLSKYDADILTQEKDVAMYFTDLCLFTKQYKIAANIMNGCVRSYLNENAISIDQFNIEPKQLASLVKLIDSGKINNTIANNKIFPEMLNSNKMAEDIAKEKDWIQESDTNTMNDYIKLALNKYPEKVEEYKKGKKGLIGLFMGEIMKLSKGKADPKIANKLLQNELNK